jgi:D-sedoheptulose 7-phosphate isomerase
MGRFEDHLEAHVAVAGAVRDELAAPFARMLETWVSTVRGGGKILLFGNGGSAADAQHIATELVVRFSSDRDPVAAIALTTDTSALTAIGNDLGFEELFARQIDALGRPGDLAVAISTSGNSPNILKGLRAARAGDMTAAALGGRGGGALVGLAEPLIVVPSDSTAHIQEMHITLGHMLCDGLERELGLV